MPVVWLKKSLKGEIIEIFKIVCGIEKWSGLAVHCFFCYKIYRVLYGLGRRFLSKNRRQLVTLEPARPKELMAKKVSDAKSLHSLAFYGTQATYRGETIGCY